MHSHCVTLAVLLGVWLLIFSLSRFHHVSLQWGVRYRKVLATDDYSPGLMSRVVELQMCVTSWTNKDVCAWLNEINLGRLTRHFKSTGIDGPALGSMKLLEISDDPLHNDIWNALGITLRKIR